MSDKKFTLYWLDGKRQVITGESIEQAYTQAGYGAGAVRAVDFYIEGDNHEYDWNKEKRSWDRKEPLEIEKLLGTHITVTPKPTPDEEAKLAQGYSWNTELRIETGKYKLMVSHNLGATYRCEYSTDDKDDPELKRRIGLASYNFYRYYVEGDDSVVAPAHQAIIEALGVAKPSYQQGITEAHINMLRGKFGK